MRSAMLARELAALGHRVEVESFVTRNHAQRRIEEGGLSLRERHSLWIDLAAAADRARLVPATELPAWTRPLAGWLRRRTAQGEYDAVVFGFLWFTGLYGAVESGAAGTTGARAQRIYLSHNVESEYWGPHLARFAGAATWERRLLRYEQRAIREADAVAACSERDRAWMIERAGAAPGRVRIVANGYDARRVRRPEPDERARLRRELGFGEGEKIAIFVGSDTPANRAAAGRLAREIAPGLRGIAGLRILIVGSVGDGMAGEGAGPTPMRRRGAASGGVEWVRKSNEIWKFLMAADVGLNPIEEGSGSNIKMAEYCGAGLAVVTTEFGLRGFEPLRPWVTVAAPFDFAGAIQRASWPNQIPASELEQYTWAAAARELAGMIEEGRK